MTCSNDEKFSSRGLGPSRNFLSLGGPSMALSREEIREHVRGVLGQYGNARGVMLLPPDATREHSGAGEITADCVDALGSRVAGVMPTLGTHRPMNEAEWARMFPGVDPSLHMVHNWRSDVMTLGTFPGNYVKAVTDGIWEEPYPVQINRLVADDHIDLVVSIGQVVPHEVLGMANHMKNVLVGCGGKAGIDQSHYIGALCGIEKVLGQPDNPVRHFLTKALYDFLDFSKYLFILTVVGNATQDEIERGLSHHNGYTTRGLFIGTGVECFFEAAELSRQVNFTILEKPLGKTVVYLDPDEYQTTWLGNKAIYRTRLAVADGGELIVLAPGVRNFGEDDARDQLVRKHGYQSSRVIKQRVMEDEELASNLGVAAHLVHGYPERRDRKEGKRFEVIYATADTPLEGRMLSAQDVESVGYAHGSLDRYMGQYGHLIEKGTGLYHVGGEEIFFVRNPSTELLRLK